MKRIFMNGLLIIFACLLAGCMSEFILRILGYGTLYVNREQVIFWTYDPLLGWHHRPGQQGVFKKSQFSVDVSINRKGLRDRLYPYERTVGKKRILVLGDSFVWGFGVEQDQIFTEQLELSLSNVEVINAGVSGYSTDQELLWLKSEGVKYKPDLIILLVSGNDDYENHLGLNYTIYSKPRFIFGKDGQLELQNVPVPRQSVFRKMVHLGMRYSSLVNFLVQEVRPKFFRIIRGSQNSSKKEISDTSERPEPGKQLGLTLALVDEIRKIAETEAQFMIVMNSVYWSKYSAGTYKELVRELRDNRVYVLDVDTSAGYSKERMTIPGDGHWNKDGHRFVAERVLELIGEKKLLDLEDSRTYSIYK